MATPPFVAASDPESSSLGLKSSEAAPIVMVVETEKTKAVAVVNGNEGVSPAGSKDERKDNDEDAGVDGAEHKNKEDKGDGADDVGSNAGVDIGNHSGGDTDSTKGREASGPLPNFWKKAWNSEEVANGDGPSSRTTWLRRRARGRSPRQQHQGQTRKKHWSRAL
jgi:hypothetical protein